eukprot:RCo053340
MLVLPIGAATCGILEAIWELWCSALSPRFQEKFPHVSSDNELSTADIRLPQVSGAHTIALSTFSLVTPSESLPRKTHLDTVSQALIVHLIVCVAVSVSYLFHCDGAGPLLGAASVGFGLCAGDAVALGLSLVLGRSRGWRCGFRSWMLALTRGWVVATALAWPLALVWLDSSSVAVSHLSGVVVWGVVGVLAAFSEANPSSTYQLSTTSVSTVIGTKSPAVRLAVLGVYSVSLALAGIFVPCSVSAERALLFEVVIPFYAWLHFSFFRPSPFARERSQSDLRHSISEIAGQLQQRIAQLELEMTTLNAKAGCVSTLAHEVRTPLNALLACCTLLGDTALEATQRELLELILSCGSQITNN